MTDEEFNGAVQTALPSATITFDARRYREFTVRVALVEHPQCRSFTIEHCDDRHATSAWRIQGWEPGADTLDGALARLDDRATRTIEHGQRMRREMAVLRGEVTE